MIKKENHNTENNSWIIWDQEVEKLLDWEDLLGTKSYTQILKDIVDSLQESEIDKWFNIWLYWWWWSWKSSIVKSLENEYLKNC